MDIHYADRIKNLPPYLFDKIDRLKNEMEKKGADIIDLGVGDPDLPTPAPIIEALTRAAHDPQNHRYPSFRGMQGFREAVSRWYQKRFSLTLDPEREALSVIGSKEGLSHIPVAFVNPNDIVLCPEPAYPVYSIASSFAGGKVYEMPLRAENDFLPDLSHIPDDVARRAVLMFINYPNNPTAASATDDFFSDVVAFAEKNNIVVVHDAAYSELYFTGEKPKSFLETDGAKDVGIEIHSLSKTFNMTGWRVGFAVGNADCIGGFGKAKSNMDSGIFQPIQYAGIYALDHSDDLTPPLRATYGRRRNVLEEALTDAGLSFTSPDATFYFWVGVPKGETSESFTTLLLEKAHIVVTPGSGFGKSGEGFVRLTLCTEEQRLKEAGERITDVMKKR
jgi:LL-diaminopimelate aminotransferase